VVSFGVLGPVQVRAGGELVVLPVKPRTLLAVLVLDAGRMASRDRLMAALWPGTPPASAVRVLRTYVSAAGVRRPGRAQAPGAGRWERRHRATAA
jgi:DNA-binding SARP family transcriptional activator